MKYLLFLVFIAVSLTTNAQSFFKPIPKLSHNVSLSIGNAQDSILNSLRPVVAISALVSDGTALAGGFGAGFEHLKWDASSQSWITVYSISAIAFIGTGTTGITGTGGLIFGLPGTNGIIGVGPGYDFTNKKVVLMTGAQIQFK